MRISLEQAIEIHARALAFRFRASAGDRAREWARALSANGDAEGEKVWLSVAEAIDRLDGEAEPTLH